MASSNVTKSAAQWVIHDAKAGFDGLELETKGIPSLGPHDVLVKMKAASLNFRVLFILTGSYPFLVPTTDGAGEVVAIGPQVKQFKEGDKDNGSIITGLGGVLGGALREYGVFHEQGLVLKPGQYVLVQGTGGVSIFALQFAKAAGAFVVATSSSADKAKFPKEQRADVLTNYGETPNWGEEARKHTPNSSSFGRIVEIGGPHTLLQSLAAIKFGGIISLIRFSLFRVCTVRGILVGSRDMVLGMGAAVEVNVIKPVVDKKIFGFKEAKDAYLYQWEQKHIEITAVPQSTNHNIVNLSKVVIKINE
ncbi:zinc-binding oxidoreductase [Choiromyces venosus 120613-1]|uniref:Zinc-binding oxidoreductase n=1 Tax=Choiromyces venosus 120613-1 TaxID=1336337 RepID=A0A3N4JIY8_9PEZI|nr:zinc-binding oxidoreductase [Choiromyces venosus 120613-1]